MRLGNKGGKNKGKKYLKITGNETITPENRAKSEKYKEWFGKNYQHLQFELAAKRTYDEDILNDTFIRIFEKILYGGLDIADNKAYFHRAFFTNYVQESINKTKIAHLTVSEDYATYFIEDSFEDREEVQLKNQNYENMLESVKDKFGESGYNLFTTYLQLGEYKYKLLSETTNTPQREVKQRMSKIKRHIQKDRQFAHVEQAM